MDIRIEKHDNMVVWEVPVKKLAKDIRVSVANGCVAVVCVDGSAIAEFLPGQSNLLNQGNQIVKAYGKKANVCLYAFNSEKEVEVKWGIGRSPATYNDKRIGDVQLAVTAYGRCNILVSDAGRLIGKLPKDVMHDGGVTPEEIVEFVQRDIIQKIGPLLSHELSKIGDHTLVQSRLSEMANKLTYGISNMNHLGLRVCATAVDNLDHTEESKAIIERYRCGQIEPLNTRIVEERAKQVRVMAEAQTAGQPGAAAKRGVDVTVNINETKEETQNG